MNSVSSPAQPTVNIPASSPQPFSGRAYSSPVDFLPSEEARIQALFLLAQAVWPEHFIGQLHCAEEVRVQSGSPKLGFPAPKFAHTKRG